MKILIAVLSLAAVGASAENIPAVGVRDAIAAAVATNLTTKLAQADDEAARARALEAASALLPSVLGTASQARVFRENLASQGLTFGGINPMIGPFDSFDARARLTQTLFDLSSIRRYRAAGAGKELAVHEEALAREQVAAAAALSYIEAVRAKKSVAAARADADLASDLLRLAEDQHAHGTATGVDVVRAKTRLSDSDVALQRARLAERQAEIKLMRVAGWPLSQSIELKDDLTPGATAVAAVEASLAGAVSSRPEIRIADARLRVDRELLGAAQGGRAPVLAASADIGLSGNLPDSGARTTGGIAVGLSLPLFSGGLIAGQVREARSALAKSEARMADVRVQVEEDMRLAYETDQEAAHEVGSARQTVELAQQELTMSQDQYAAGTGDNIQVVTAQDELTRARDTYVTALARQQDARVNLAAALGQAQSFSF
jgi:outer membrane protein TolC